MQQIYHKKNELFEVEFYKDKEYTEAFDFTNAKNLYIDGLNGDLSPLIGLDLENINFYVYTPYLPKQLQIYTRNIKTLDEITPNLSKYIPEDNAVLFLSEEDKMRFYVNEFSQKVFSKTPLVSQYCIDKGDFPRNIVYGHFNDNNSSYTLNGKQKGVHPIYRKIKIFLPHGTHSELQKANEVAKELKEKYGVEEVNLFALHWFYKNEDYDVISFLLYNKIFNKIITTNSTGILKPEDSNERLQVIDCKEVFEDSLKTQR
jgi:hypothetical protein